MITAASTVLQRGSDLTLGSRAKRGVSKGVVHRVAMLRDGRCAASSA